jgi:methionyl-tRNA formyltransferase
MRLLRHKSLLWHLYEQRYVHPRTHWNRTVDLAAILNSVPVLRSRTIRKGRFSEYFSEPDLQAIRARELDFILRFAFGIIRGPILESARYGVWSFHHGDPEKYRGGPYCLWELRRKEPRTHVVLQRLTAKLDGGIVLKSGSVPTALEGLAANRDRALELGVGFPAEVCRDIQDGNAGYLDGPPLAAPGKLYVAPSNLEMLAWFLGLPS